MKLTCFLKKLIEAIQENQQEGMDFKQADNSNTVRM